MSFFSPLASRFSLRNFLERIHPYRIAFVSGLLLAIAINYPAHLWWILLVAFVPLLYRMRSIEKRVAWKASLIFGTAFMGGVIWWFTSVYPLDWLHIESPVLSWMLIFIAWALAAIFLGIFPALWMFIASRTKGDVFASFLFLPALWVMLEYARAFAFSLLFFGEESLVGPHYAFGFLGPTLLWFTPLSAIASVGGMALLGFIAIAWNLFWLIHLERGVFRKSLHRALLFMLLLIVPFLFSYFFTHHNEEEDLHLALIHTHFPPDTLDREPERLIHIQGLIETIAKQSPLPDIIILPEDSRFLFYLEKNALTEEYLKRLFGDREILLIDSARSVRNGALSSFITTYNTKTKDALFYQKNLLVPQGEYTPLVVDFLSSLAENSNWRNTIQEERGYARGKNLVVSPVGEASVGSLLCSEIYSPLLYRKLTRDRGATLLVNLSSHALFNNSDILSHQVLSFAKAHALENNRFFIQAGDNAPSYVIDNQGRILTFSEKQGDRILFGSVRSIREPSLYSRVEPWLLSFFCFMIIIYFFHGKALNRKT